MLAVTKKNELDTLVAGASYEDLLWINGYLSGLLSVKEKAQVAAETIRGTRKMTIAYGTETGNAKSLSVKLSALAKKQGHVVKLAALDQYRLHDLAKEEWLYVVISTQGDGEPPAAAKKFYDHIHEGNLSLPQLQYGVIALGDTAYPLFCQAGIDVDLQLEKTGAKRIAAMQQCDTDYEAVAVKWFEQTLASDGINTGEPQAATATVANTKSLYSGSILSHINLNDHGSAKETYHIEIAADGVAYEPGDSLSILPQNTDYAVAQILEHLPMSADVPLSRKGRQVTVKELLYRSNILYLQERTVKAYAAIVQQEIPVARIGLAELLRIYPPGNELQFQQVLHALEPVVPRLYSISSAPAAHDGAVHLSVSRSRFYINDEWRYGLCSDMLAKLKEGDTLGFSIHRNLQFRLPAADKDIIMIGPGTGIAPFRSFLAERDATNAPGRNWLFFGEQHFTTDFLYQAELQNWLDTGLLTKLSLAFSRDQPEKIYVQHKLLQQAKEIYEWLAQGAYIYVCGSKDPMSNDVELALLQVIAAVTDCTEDAAVARLLQLKEEGRYVLDVY